jgi:hypothetical protein
MLKILSKWILMVIDELFPNFLCCHFCSEDQLREEALLRTQCFLVFVHTREMVATLVPEVFWSAESAEERAKLSKTREEREKRLHSAQRVLLPTRSYRIRSYLIRQENLWDQGKWLRTRTDFMSWKLQTFSVFFIGDANYNRKHRTETQ